MCGPCCPVDSALDSFTSAHIHPCCTRKDAKGFPKHRLPGHNPRNEGQLPSPLPRAYREATYHLQRTRKPGQSLVTPEELRIYSSGALHQMSPADVPRRMKIGRYLDDGERPNTMSPVAVRRPANAHLKAVSAREIGHMSVPHIPARLSLLTDTAKASPQPPLVKFASTEGLLARTRQPAAYAPTPGYPASFAPSGPSDKGTGYFSGLERVRGSLRIRNARAASSQLSTANPWTEEIEMRTLSSGSSAESRTSSRNRPASSRRAEPLIRTAIRKHRSSNAGNSMGERKISSDPEGEFTLRHVQLMIEHRIKARLQALEESRKRLDGASQYDDVDHQIEKLTTRLMVQKAELEQANLRRGSSGADDGPWMDLLFTLGSVENAVSKEMVRLGVESDGKCSEPRVAQRSGRSTATENEMQSEDGPRLRSIESIPSVRQNMTRSLSF